MADSTLALDVHKADGKKAGSVELPAALFDVKTRNGSKEKKGWERK